MGSILWPAQTPTQALPLRRGHAQAPAAAAATTVSRGLLARLRPARQIARQALRAVRAVAEPASSGSLSR